MTFFSMTKMRPHQHHLTLIAISTCNIVDGKKKMRLKCSILNKNFTISVFIMSIFSSIKKQQQQNRINIM